MPALRIGGFVNIMLIGPSSVKGHAIAAVQVHPARTVIALIRPILMASLQCQQGSNPI